MTFPMPDSPTRQELAAEKLEEQIADARCPIHDEMIVDEIDTDYIRLACAAKGCDETVVL